MRRMYSEKQLTDLIKNLVSAGYLADVLAGQDLSLANLSITQNLVVHESAKLFEQIVDADEHIRFLEGDGTPLSQEGVTISYCKWSLSGTHLMMVLAGTIADTTAIANGVTLARFTLPEWVFNKIYPVWGNGYIERKSLSLTADNWSIQNLTIALFKDTASMRILSIDNALTLNADRSFRVAFDLLIDNEQSVEP